MECPWRRTLASVLLLLSPHRFLCQNVVPTGPLPLQPLVKQPLRECASIPGPIPKQLIPSANGIISEYVPRSQCSAEYQRIPEYTGPTYPQACSSVPQTNIGPFFQGAAFGVSQINNFPQIQGPICNTLPNTNTLTQQTPSLNIISTPQIPNNVPVNSPITDLSPIQEISPISLLPPGSQFPNFDIPKFSKGFKSKIAPVSSVPNLQNQILPCSQRSFVPTPGSVLNVPLPTKFPNQDTLTLPLMSNPYSQSFVQPPVSASCKSVTDLTLLNYLPTPNLPASMPIQNCVPIFQVPVPPVVCPNLIPADYVSNSPVSPNCQISALPPVFPAQLNNDFCRNPASVTDEYTPVPINLQINVPPPTIPDPQITIITAYPPAPPVPVPVPESSDTSFGLYPPYPLPPIIIEGRKSRARSLLPLILIALIANDGCGGGGCCCCCPCGVANSYIPIPYPIPIPTNNPLIIRSTSKSCNTTSN